MLDTLAIFEYIRYQCSALTILVSYFAQKTRENAHETNFFICSRNEILWAEFYDLLTNPVFTKQVFWFPHEMTFLICSRNEFLRLLTTLNLAKRFLLFARETSFLCALKNEFSLNECSLNELLIRVQIKSNLLFSSR